MQSSPLLLLRSKTASLIQSLRMLSSSSSLTNPNPNFSMRTPTSEIPTLFPFLKISKTATSISKLYSNVQNNGISLISCASMSEMGNPEADLDKSNSNSNSNSLVVVSFYKFADFPDHADMRKPLKELCEDVIVSCNNNQRRVIDWYFNRKRIGNKFIMSQWMFGWIADNALTIDGPSSLDVVRGHFWNRVNDEFKQHNLRSREPLELYRRFLVIEEKCEEFHNLRKQVALRGFCRPTYYDLRSARDKWYKVNNEPFPFETLYDIIYLDYVSTQDSSREDFGEASCPIEEWPGVTLTILSVFAPHQADPVQRVSGGIILASEGINGSICGTKESVERVLEYIQSDKRLNGLRQIESPVSPEEEAIHHGHTSGSPLAAGEDAPFRWDHVRVKVKKEIVSLGMPTVSPIEKVGKYVSPRDWNALISDPDTVVVDVRNMYETRIGKFKGAVNPCTKTFREFPSWVDDRFQLAESDGQQSNDSNKSMEQESKVHEPKTPPRVAMYCTGGIRCEKASSFLLSKGFKEVYHLEGGILKYLEEVPKTDSLWEGECFVFDKRVSVEHGLAQGTFKLCYGCKQPVSDADMESPRWEYGVTCPYCFSAKSEEEKERARARQTQFETWGVIGGPDKGHRPLTTSLQAGDMEKKLSYLSTSV
ncbi:hypothetical protein GIB67_041101 [Kingdonia uniflora]|uniref:Rhodanese domain-containing protein n=1 Tax=Kingdonia uniflora TaxID=39325 RepID=A0A7J7LK79_9MAGN|nr:hypothetical protein GIB67_041101 [Kingdonia uniflora]